MTRCFFISDLHGRVERYRTLFDLIAAERPDAVMLGGDLLPHHWSATVEAGDFIEEVLRNGLRGLRRRLGGRYPQLLVVLGNDDERLSERSLLDGEEEGLWTYCHERWVELAGHPVLGYSAVPPTPFQLKDWERHDVSRYVDPGAVSPEAGRRTVDVDADEVRHGTIAGDLERLAAGRELESALLLFHSPPYDTDLDRADLDGQSIDHVPLDVHVGSVAIRRFIEQRQPLLTLHGHIHEAPRLTGSWRQKIGRTHCFTAAHDGPELAVVRFDLEHLEDATRELV